MIEAVPTGNTYDKYASSNPIERRMMENFLHDLDRSLPTLPPATVLEVGIGEGEIAARITTRFPTASVTGLDLPDPDLAAHWTTRQFVAVFGDIAKLPFPDDTFDLVLAIEVLEHVARPDAALREVARVARADVVLSVPREPMWRVGNMARGKYWKALGNTPGHIQHWGKRPFADLVARHLDVTAVRSPLPWTMVAARVRSSV